MITGTGTVDACSFLRVGTTCLIHHCDPLPSSQPGTREDVLNGGGREFEICFELRSLTLWAAFGWFFVIVVVVASVFLRQPSCVSRIRNL